MGYNSNYNNINSIIGRKIEGIKVELKRAKEDYIKISKKKDLDVCEIFLLDNGKNIIKKTENAIEKFKDIDFINIVDRSMKKCEICIGRIDECNLRVMERVEIGTLKNLYYNLVEEDIYEYLLRIRRKKILINIDKILDEYIEIARLSSISKDYISILLEVPYDSLKQWRKFRNNKKILSSNEYLRRIVNSYNNEIN